MLMEFQSQGRKKTDVSVQKQLGSTNIFLGGRVNLSVLVRPTCIRDGLDGAHLNWGRIGWSPPALGMDWMEPTCIRESNWFYSVY